MQFFFLNQILIGLQVRIVHRGNPKTKYKIDGLSKELTKDVKFHDNDGCLVNAVDFFLREFQWPIRYTLLPCLMVKKTLFIPMEVCEVMSGIIKYCRFFSLKVNRQYQIFVIIYRTKMGILSGK